MIVVAFYAGYLLYLRTASSHSTLGQPHVFRPPVSIIVPVYNESMIIEKKIENIRNLSYPKDKLEVVFVDGNSSDATPTLIQKSIDSGDKYIKLLPQPKREGYNQAILTGILNSTSDIIVLTDAASFHDPDAVSYLVDRLSDSNVGVVTGKAVMLNEEEGFLPSLESEYRNFHDFIRLAESRIDSTPDMKGELLAARKDLCVKLASTLRQLERASFDMSLSYQARLEGFRAIFEPRARFYEYAPTSLRDRFKVQTRRAVFFVGTLLSFKAMLLNKRYGAFGTAILPAHLVMLAVVPWIAIACGTLLILDIFLDPVFALSFWSVSAVAMLSKRIRALASSFALAQVALAAALLRLLLGRTSQMIDTAKSTRR